MDYFIGTIMAWSSPAYIPVGWCLCDGRLLSIAQNSALFSVLQNKYGGDGVNNFALPNLCGRVIVSSRIPGEMNGYEMAPLIPNQMPAHTHGLQANTNGNTPGESFPDNSSGLGIAKSGRTSYKIYNQNSANSPKMVNFSPASILGCGGDQPHPNTQPYLSVTYIICMEGIYPPRP